MQGSNASFLLCAAPKKRDSFRDGCRLFFYPLPTEIHVYDCSISRPTHGSITAAANIQYRTERCPNDSCTIVWKGQTCVRSSVLRREKRVGTIRPLATSTCLSSVNAFFLVLESRRGVVATSHARRLSGFVMAGLRLWQLDLSFLFGIPSRCDIRFFPFGIL